MSKSKRVHDSLTWKKDQGRGRAAASREFDDQLILQETGMTKSNLLNVGYCSLAAGMLIFVGMLWLTTIHP
jgi:hypothetical protein